MSSSSGQVRFADGEILYYRYYGTVDVCVSHLFSTIEELNDNWRKETWCDCTCGKEETVEVFSSYGHGFYFEGKACKTCKSITSDPYCSTTEASAVKDDWANK